MVNSEETTFNPPTNLLINKSTTNIESCTITLNSNDNGKDNDNRNLCMAEDDGDDQKNRDNDLDKKQVQKIDKIQIEDSKLNASATKFVPKCCYIPPTTLSTKNSLKSILDTIDEYEKEENESKQMEPKLFVTSKRDLMPIKCAGTIEIPRNLTQNVIPSAIKENIANIYYFMDKSMTLRTNRKILKNDNLVIINYNFHHRETDEILYCIIKKQDPAKHRGFSWIMMDRLFTKKEILIEFNISEKELILPLSSRFDSKMMEQMGYIHSIHNILETQLIFGIVERTQWHRIPIYNKKNNKQKKVLYLTKKEFMNRIEHFIVNTRNINIIPIMMLNSNKEYWIEHIYIIKIDENIHIGVSMKYKPHRNRVEVTGIHLNKEYILNKHQLASPNHDCSCLEHFRSDIDDLKIGNIDEDKNRIKDLQKRYEMMKNENERIKKVNISLRKQEGFYKSKYLQLKQFLKRLSKHNTPISQILNDLDDNHDLSTIPIHEIQPIHTNTNAVTVSAASIVSVPSLRIQSLCGRQPVISSLCVQL